MSSAKTLCCASLPLALFTALTATAQVKNPGFEVGGTGIHPPGWHQVGGVRQDGPEGAGLGGPGNDSALITAGMGVMLPGPFRGAGIRQVFDCGNPQVGTACFIRFAYAYDDSMAPASSAFVAIDGPAGLLVAALPDNLPPGPQRVQVAYPVCGKLALAFGVVEADVGMGMLSMLLVDQIQTKCDTQAFAGTPVLALGPYPTAAGDPLSELLQRLYAPAPFTDLGHGKAGAGDEPWLLGSGSMQQGSSNSIHVANAAPLRPTALIVGANQANVPFLGGLLVPSPDLVLTFTTDANGAIDLPFTLPAAVPAGVSLYAQDWILEAGGTIAATNGLQLTAQ